MTTDCQKFNQVVTPTAAAKPSVVNLPEQISQNLIHSYWSSKCLFLGICWQEPPEVICLASWIPLAILPQGFINFPALSLNLVLRALSLLLLNFIFYFMCMSVFLNVCVCTRILEEGTEFPQPPELELMVASCYVGADNWLQILKKESQYS